MSLRKLLRDTVVKLAEFHEGNVAILTNLVYIKEYRESFKDFSTGCLVDHLSDSVMQIIEGEATVDLLLAELKTRTSEEDFQTIEKELEKFSVKI